MRISLQFILARHGECSAFYSQGNILTFPQDIMLQRFLTKRLNLSHGLS